MKRNGIGKRFPIFHPTFAPVLKVNGGGAFAQVNSVVSLKSFANFATYSASKAAATMGSCDIGLLPDRFVLSVNS